MGVILLCDTVKFKDKDIFDILRSYPDYIYNCDNFSIFDSSSTNLIVGIDSKYVVKKKKVDYSDIVSAT